MFGKKKEMNPEELQQLKELMAHKERVLEGQQPMGYPPQQSMGYPPQPPMGYPMQPPMGYPQPMQPAQAQLDTTIFFIVRKKLVQREKFTWSPSGQQVKTGEVETVEMFEPVYNLTFDDFLEIVSYSKSNLKDTMKALLRESLMVR